MKTCNDRIVSVLGSGPECGFRVDDAFADAVDARLAKQNIMLENTKEISAAVITEFLNRYQVTVQ